MTGDELNAIETRKRLSLVPKVHDTIGEASARYVIEHDVPKLVDEVRRLHEASVELDKLASVVRERVRTWKHHAAEYGDAMGSEQMIRLREIKEILDPLADAASAIAKTMK